jgi:uncharacterized protein DUF6057
MRTTTDTPAEGRRILGWAETLFPARVVVFLTVLGVYLHLGVNMRLVFWNQYDLFLWNDRFARDFMVSAGLPVEWLGKLWLQPCHQGWLGALVVVVVLWGLFISAEAYYSRIELRSRFRFTWLIPTVLLAVLHSQYTFSLSGTAGLALALAASNAYVRVFGQRWWARLAVFIVASMLLCWTVGEAYYTFAGCCVVYELLVAKKRSLGLSFLLVVPAVTFGIDTGLFHVNSTYLHCDIPEVSYLIPPHGWERWALVLLYAYFPACAMLLVAKPAAIELWNRLRQRVDGGDGGRIGAETEVTCDNPAGQPGCVCQKTTFWRMGARTIWRWVLTPLLLVIITVVGVEFSGSRNVKRMLAIDYYSSHRMWGDVLREANGLPSEINRDTVGQDLYLALYHTGRLPYDMFSYPPSRLIVDHGYGIRGRLLSRKACDLYLELGRVNEAETILHNAMEQHVSARLLLRLAIVKMVKGQGDAARLYLNVLSDDMLYGPRAKGYLEQLRKDPELAGDREISNIRSLMLRTDDTHFVYGPGEDRSLVVSVERQLLSLLEENPQNRMAFEYLMALRLLNMDVKGLVAELPRAKAFSYSAMPPLYEEAAVICAVDYTHDLVMTETSFTACGWPISQETAWRCNHLHEIEIDCRGLHNRRAERMAASRLKNTYIFYYFYGSNQSR